MAAKTVSKLNIVIGARSDKLRKDLQQTNRQVQTFSRRIESSTPKLGAWATAVKAAAISLAGLAAATGVGTLAKLAAEAETAHTAFTVLLQSGSAATTMLAEMREFAASTPLQQGDIIDSGRMLLAFGENAQEVVPTLRRLGDVGSLTGNRLQDLAEIYGKARVQGTLFAEDLNQLTGRGVPILQEFAKQLGVGAGEVKKLASEGKVSFENLRQAFIDLTAEGGKFAGGMAKQAQTLGGQWSTLKDQAAELGRTIGTALLPVFKELVQTGQRVLESIKNVNLGYVRTVAQLAIFVGAAGVAIAVMSRVVAAIGFIVTALKTQTAAQIIANSVTLKGALMTAAALGIGYAAARAAGQQFDKLTNSMKESGKAAKQNAAGVEKIEQTVAKSTKAVDDNAKAVEKAMEKWQQLGDSMTERLRTPFEKLRDSLAEARTALELGVISMETFERASADAFKTYDSAQLKPKKIEAPTSPGAVSAGSQAAYAAVARHMGMMTAEKQRQEQARRLAARRDKLLERLNDTTEGVAEAVRQNRIEITKARL